MRPAADGAVLGLDTATPDTAVAVVSPAEPQAERLIGPGPRGRPRHAPELLGAIEACVAEAGGWERIRRIAVGVGPGSFTGLRIGVATARALAQARGLPLAAVGSLEALAAGIGELPEARDRPRLAVIDARRGEVFALLASAPGEPAPPGPEPPAPEASRGPSPGDGREVAGEPLLADPGALGARIVRAPGALAAGDGAVRFRSAIEAAGAEVLGDEHPAHRISARCVCLLGAAGAAGPPEGVLPRYIREPDAERWIDRDRRS